MRLKSIKKIVILFLILISSNVFSQKSSNKTVSEPITLEKFVENIKEQNQSLKNSDSINVMVNDLLIENLETYMIDPKNISKLEILVLDPKRINQTKPSIIITTRIK
ncbi:hypothetical protein [Flavobacterium sp.]|uniref:hypothetical protein n=1 Tax=Flavobacterium sp. TaxID=239 RepID=UPI003751F01D